MKRQRSAEEELVTGIRIDPVTSRELIARLLSNITPKPLVAIGVNAHVSNLAASDAVFAKQVAEADFAYADGYSIVVAARLLGRDLPERIATTDLIYPLARECARLDKKLYLFGGEPGVAEAAAAVLRTKTPGLKARARNGYDEATPVSELLADIRQFEADVLLVGLGDPVQQEWIVANKSHLECSAVLSCGGLFDWTSGRNRRAPTWMIRAGLEWLWRLAIEPRRLARRYLLGNPMFLARLTRQLVRVNLTRLQRTAR